MVPVLLLLAAVSTVDAYVALSSLSYVRLEDANGAFTVNASTYVRVAFDEEEGILYAVSKEPDRLSIFTLNNDGTLTLQSVTAFQEATKGQVLDVEYCDPGPFSPQGGSKRLAISFMAPTSDSAAGKVRFYSPVSGGNYQLGAAFKEITVGAQPIDMEFGMDCMLLVVANRGRPTLEGNEVRDPDGSVTKMTLPLDFTAESEVTVTNIGFSSVNDPVELNLLMQQGFRPWPTVSGGTPIQPSKNVEPNHVIVAPNGMTIYVALTKNNAVARINVDTLIPNIMPLGERDWNQYYLDASRSDGGAQMRRYDIYSTFQPRQVKWVVQENAQWMITLDSGVIDDIPEYNYMATRPGSVLAAGTDGTAPPISVSPELLAALQDNAQLGEAEISIEDGKNSEGTTLTRLYLNGARGLSIHDGNTFEVATSLTDNIERVSAQNHASIFNGGVRSLSNTPQQDKEATSPTFGPDLSVIETGIFEGQKVLFLGSAESGIIYVYELVPDTQCPQPYFHSSTRFGNTFSSWSNAYSMGQMGDIGITDMLYIPRAGQRTVDVLIVGSSISNSIHSYRVSDQ